jgi:hypothetical protein
MADLIEISVERLRELEALEASIPDMIDSALKDYKQNALKRLHERDKANPEAVNMRAKRYAEKNRELLNAKRREKRQLLKAKQTSTSSSSARPSSTIEIVKAPSKKTMAILGAIERDGVTAPSTHPCPPSDDGTTVRFDV